MISAAPDGRSGAAMRVARASSGDVDLSVTGTRWVNPERCFVRWTLAMERVTNTRRACEPVIRIAARRNAALRPWLRRVFNPPCAPPGGLRRRTGPLLRLLSFSPSSVALSIRLAVPLHLPALLRCLGGHSRKVDGRFRLGLAPGFGFLAVMDLLRRKLWCG